MRSRTACTLSGSLLESPVKVPSKSSSPVAPTQRAVAWAMRALLKKARLPRLGTALG